MKDLGYKHSTCTVGELINWLKKYDKNLPVVPTWEGVTTFIDEDRLYVDQWLNGEVIDVLKIDVDQD
jgi:hypothetical protein